MPGTLSEEHARAGSGRVGIFRPRGLGSFEARGRILEKYMKRKRLNRLLRLVGKEKAARSQSLQYDW